MGMQAYGAPVLARRRHGWRSSHVRARSRSRENRPANYPYRGAVTSPAVRRANFAEWVKRALQLARRRGMNDAAIHEATGISPATFHRWQTLKGGLPVTAKAEQFAQGLEMRLAPMYEALGVSLGRRAATEPEMDPDLMAIGRRLADPSVSEDEKAVIRNTLKLLAGRPLGRRSGDEQATG